MIVIGVDPGTHTGVAVWHAGEAKFLSVEALPVHRALEFVRQRILSDRLTPVIFEDARLRTWFGSRDANVAKFGAGVREGAGAAKRDAAIWEAFLEDMGCPYLARKPSSGSTKWNADQFRRLTRWDHKTNEHGRDAGVLVFGLTLHEVGSLVRSWEQQRANQATRTPARR